MPEPRDDRIDVEHPDIDGALHRLSEQVDVPPRPDYASMVRHRIDSLPHGARGPQRRAHRLVSLHPLAAAGVILLAVMAVTVAVPAGREAIANLLEISGVRVRTLPPATSAPRTTLDPQLDLGEPVTLAEAQRRISFTITLPSDKALGAPDSVYVHSGTGVESVTLLYQPRPGLPEILDSGVGLLLSEYAGSAAPYFDKYIDERRPPTRVTVAGRWLGLHFSGPQQVLIRDSAGVVHDEHPRVSAPTLVWVRGAVTYRLEADIDQKRALAIAATIG
ncbi:MAG: hypothetical protein ABJA81_04440 [Nocardioidaceae bacterium]